MDGILIVNKEKGMSSHDVVFKLRKILQTKKIGHCGTLDPQVNGVLVCVVNKGCKLAQFLTLDTKEYIATLRLGYASTTQDLEGDIIAEKPFMNDVDEKQVLEVLNSFIGIQEQIPSIYSAIKVKGKKLYEYARANETVEIPVRTINIMSIDFIKMVNNEITFKVNCGSGTYVRSLCFDIAEKLGYPGLMSDLVRTRSGHFNLDHAASLDDIRAGKFKMVSLVDALEIDKVIINDNQVITDIKNGKPLKINKDKLFLTCDSKDNALALYNPSIDGIAKVARGLF